MGEEKVKRVKQKNKKRKNTFIGLGLATVLFGSVATATVAIANNKLDASSTINKIDEKNNDDKGKENIEEKQIAINESTNINKENTTMTDKKDNSTNISENNDSAKNTISTSEAIKDQKESNEVKKPEAENNSVNSNKTSTQGNIVTAPTNGSNIIDSAKSYAVNRFDVAKMVKGTYSGPLDNEKTVFLTFDDGPSKNTPKVLDTLNKYGVHGTFFVLGGQVKGGADYIKRIYNEGNAIGNHSYTHDFATLYPKNKINVSTYMNEYYKTENALKSVLGNNFNTKVVRMPGGENSRQYYKDPNLSELKKKFSNEGIASIDWNALNGDAEGKRYTVSQMVDYVKRSSAGQKHVVVLMHDAATKGLTVEALPQIIEYFKSQGYNFKVIS